MSILTVPSGHYHEQRFDWTAFEAVRFGGQGPWRFTYCDIMVPDTCTVDMIDGIPVAIRLGEHHFLRPTHPSLPMPNFTDSKIRGVPRADA